MTAAATTGDPIRIAEVIAVGSELLGWTRVDTNSLHIARRLADLGIELRAKAVVGDDRDRIRAVFSGALGRADLVVLTGGLGPTDDDLTRESVSGVLGLPLEEHEDLVRTIEARFARRGLAMPAVNRRQAQVLRGARALHNPNGTAPGQYLEHGGRAVLLLPGPPRELQPMLDRVCDEILSRRVSGERLHRRTIFITGRGESHVEEVVQPIYSQWRTASPPIETTILASPGQIELHLFMRSAEADTAERIIAVAQAQLADALGDGVFSLDGRSMEKVVGDLLRERRLTFAAAESCTGGLLLSRLTDVPGSSDYIAGGAVVYSNAMKTELAGVPADMLKAHGAVSEPVALALAEGIRARSGADVGAGITGIAGPGGGTPQKPVGTVVVAVAAPPAPARVRTFQFPGDRAMVRHSATQAALDMVRRVLSR